MSFFYGRCFYEQENINCFYIPVICSDRAIWDCGRIYRYPDQGCRKQLSQIRSLLQTGKNELAVEKARVFVASLKTVSGNEARQLRYFALNALCAALTSTGEIKEALDACSRAIKLNPSLWHAINTRGTAYYVSGQFEPALKDYRKALSMVKGSKPLVDLIQHNIELTENKKTDSK